MAAYYPPPPGALSGPPAAPQYAYAPTTGVSKESDASVFPMGPPPTFVTRVAYVPAPSAGQIAASTDVLSSLMMHKGIWLAKWMCVCLSVTSRSSFSLWLTAHLRAPRSDLLNIVTGCERNNRYKLRAWDPQAGAQKASDGIRSDDIYKMKEQSDCMCRICLGSMREFKMSLYPYAEGQYPPAGADIFYLPGAVTLERPFRCTLLCLNRPVLRVRHGTVGYIGEIRYPFLPPLSLNYYFTIHSPTRDASNEMVLNAPLHVHPTRSGEPEGTMWYRVKGNFCQWGLFCFLPCGPCKKISFKIFDPADEFCTQPIGEIQKIWKDCCSALLDADSYTIDFPPNSNEVQRASLIATTILIDFCLFEARKNDDNNTGGLDFSAFL